MFLGYIDIFVCIFSFYLYFCMREILLDCVLFILVFIFFFICFYGFREIKSELGSGWGWVGLFLRSCRFDRGLYFVVVSKFRYNFSESLFEIVEMYSLFFRVIGSVMGFGFLLFMFFFIE